MPLQDNYDPNSIQATLATIISKVENVSTKQDSNHAELVNWQTRQDAQISGLHDAHTSLRASWKTLVVIGSVVVGTFTVLEAWRIYRGEQDHAQVQELTATVSGTNAQSNKP